ncbi:MAG TPA: cyclic nucleotide-binding domain-containing protein [Terriglobales bacterium]|nr:cyclic nucleotide-binding domain-containing protein [Terriglobales bacterium]
MRKALFLLGILNDSDIDWLIAHGSKRELTTSEVLIQEGKAIGNMFIVLDGSFAVSVGEAQREVARLKSGEVVGEVSFVDSRPPSASVTALEPSHVLAVPLAGITGKLESDLPFAARFYRAIAVFLADRLRHSIGQLGYGKEPSPGTEEVETDEMDPEVLDRLTLAGARFDWLQRRLRDI